jgi:hypothetical protein
MSGAGSRPRISGSDSGGGPSLFDPFPSRPRGMHHLTYDRLWRRYENAEQRSLAGLAQLAARLHDRLRSRR